MTVKTYVERLSVTITMSYIDARKFLAEQALVPSGLDTTTWAMFEQISDKLELSIPELAKLAGTHK